MDTDSGTSKKRIIRCFKFIKVVLLFSIIIVICYMYRNNLIYNSIDLSIKEEATISYGANKFNIKDYIEYYDGEKIKVLNKIDTNKVGNQEVVVRVTKKGIIKEIPIMINVVDLESPTININEEKISKNKGESFDINSNISDILDNADGKLEFLANEEVNDEKRSFYTYFSDSDINEVGVHNITVKAVDGSGNVSEKTFEYEVKEVIVPKVNPVINNDVQLNYNLPPNGAGGGIVGLAYSLVGSPYVSGGNGPGGFDCSGFVQYVYAQNGIHVSRSSYTQAYDGYAVPYSEAQPGDILSWGYGPGSITHSALYVGNGLMIHATNPRQGVLLSDVAAWTRGSGTRVITVRRII